jgi:hypothetical protein
MKYIINILFIVALLMASCTKQECLNKNENDSEFIMKSGSPSLPVDSGDGGIVETEDEDGKSKKTKPGQKK